MDPEDLVGQVEEEEVQDNYIILSNTPNNPPIISKFNSSFKSRLKIHSQLGETRNCKNIIYYIAENHTKYHMPLVAFLQIQVSDPSISTIEMCVLQYS